MQALGIGHHPDARLPDWWYDDWKNYFHFWSRIAKARIRKPSPFMGLFRIVSNAAEQWERELPPNREALFREARMDKALYEAIRHVFWVISVSEQTEDDLIVTPPTEWKPDRKFRESKHIDCVANDHIDGWAKGTRQPNAPHYLSISTICTKCRLVITPRS